MDFSSYDLFKNTTINDLSNKKFSDSDSQNSLSIRRNKNQSNFKNKVENKNSIQNESQEFKKSSIKNNYQDTISIAQNRIIITKFKLELSSLKKQFINNIANFHSLLKNSQKKILRETMNQLSVNQFLQANFGLNVNSSLTEQVQAKEEKILKLEKEIAKLKEKNEKLEQIKFNNFSYEDQIKEKDHIIQSNVDEFNDRIMQMNSIIQKQKNKIKSLQDQKYQIIQLQTLIDHKDKTLDQLKTENSISLQKIEKLQKQNEISYDDYESAFNKMEQFKKEIARCNKENSGLQSQVSILKHELEIIKENNLQISNENKKLKEEIDQKKEIIFHSTNSQNEYINQIKEKNEIINKFQNEISILNAEKSINQSLSQNKSQISSNNNENELSCLKYNSKELKKLRSAVIALNSQIDYQKSQIEEQNNLIKALRENLQQNENEMALINQNSKLNKSAIIRKEGQTLSLKSEIIRLETVINQKEQFIAEMLINDDKKSAEIDRLHLDLEEARNIISKTNFQKSDHLYSQFQEISNELKICRSKSNQQDLIVKQQKYKLQEIEQENEDLKNELKSTIKKNKLISEEKNNLQEKLKTLSLTYTSNATKMQKVIELLKNQNLEISKENSSLVKKNLELQEISNSNAKLIDQLSIENKKLQKENTELHQKIELIYIPLEKENNRLKITINQMRNHENVVLNENQKLTSQIESLKKEKDTQKSIDNRKITEKESEISQMEDKNYENQKELEKYRNIIQSILSILNVDSISIVETIQRNEKELSQTKAKLEKVSKEKKKIESENKLHKIKIKSQENLITKNNQIIDELTNKLQESKRQTDSLNSFVNQSKESFKILQNSFFQIQNQIENSENASLNGELSPSKSKNGILKNRQSNNIHKQPVKNP